MIYFAGTFIRKPNTRDEFEFALVHCTGENRPYLTKSAKGLKLTAYHANLYRLSEDRRTAFLVPDVTRWGCGGAKEIALSEEQIQAINRAIETNYFFD